MGSRTKNAKKNIVWSFVERTIALALGFLIKSATIYWLGTVYLGLGSLFSSILQVLSLTELGFGEAMVFSLYKPLADDDRVTVCALLNLYKKVYRIIGIAVCIIGIALIPFLKLLVHENLPAGTNLYVLYGIHLLNAVISYLFFAYEGALFVASQRSYVRTNITTIVTIAMHLLQILCMALFRNYYVYCILIPVASVVRNLLIHLEARKTYPLYFCEGKIDRDEKNKIRKNVSGLFLYKLSGVLRNSFDSIVLSAVLGLTTLAKYQNYYFVMNSVIGILGIISSNITASVGNSIVTESVEKNYNDFNKFLHIYMWIVCWAVTCFFCMFQPFILLWVGEELLFDDYFVIIFCIYFFTDQMGIMSYVYRQAVGIWYQDRYRPIVEGVINLSLNIILVKQIGVAGVMLSTILCLVFINTGWGANILFKEYFDNKKKYFYFIRLVCYAIVATCGCTLAGLCCSLIPFEGILELIARFCICCIVPNIFYFGVFKLFPENSEAMKFIKNKLIKLG